MMEPGRIHAYLQAACAGLGFDIGEVWFSPNEACEPIPNPGDEETGCIGDEILTTMRRGRTSERSRKIKFLQLYTSKSYNNRRNDLLRPASGDFEDTQKHVLSPDVVDVISSTAQVVWAHCPKREGLLGRSDMRVQTAVGMPVVVDSEGSMCVVVMFSAKHIGSNQNAMEYLKLLRQTTISPSIPCLLPVIDSHHKKLIYNPQRFNEWQEQKVISLSGNQEKINQTGEKITKNHEVTLAPKDPYGIPILPSTSELDKCSSPSSEDFGNAFDLASYGIWSTVMDIPSNNDVNALAREQTSKSSRAACSTSILTMPKAQPSPSLTYRCESLLSSGERPCLQPERGDRLEEFASAFLGISVFDLADVWLPDSNSTGNVGLHHLRSVSVAGRNEGLNNLMQVSQNSVIKAWSGAIGRAYNSGNPIWGTNQDLIADLERAEAITKADVKTMLAVPIYSPNITNPSGVFCCYSLIQSDSVPFLLKFVQQALATLWMGLDHVELNTNIDKDIWKDVAPADLGEMAADLEMQKAFYQKKRSYDGISCGRQDSAEKPAPNDGCMEGISRPSLSFDPKPLDMPSSVLSGSLHLNTHIGINTIGPGKRIASALSTGRMVNDRRFIRPQAMSFIALKPENNTEPHSLHVFRQNQINTFVQTKNDPIDKICIECDMVAPSNRKEDPDIAMGNIHEFNALVRNSKNQYKNIEGTKSSKNSAVLVQDHEYTKSGEKNLLLSEMISPVTSKITNDNIMTPNMLLPDALHHKTKPSLLQNQIKPSVIDATVISTVNTVLCKPIYSVPMDTMGISNPCLKECRIVGCVEVSVSRRPYCHRHSGNRLCEHPTCSKCAQGATRFCIAHGGGRRCTHKGCDKGARDKYFCAAHGGGRRCKSDGCSKSAVGGSNLCTSHGGGRRCAVDGCGKSAQSSTKFCVKHGGGKKCTYPGCDKVSRGKTAFCAGHGGGVRCKLEGCNRIAIGKMQMCKWHNQSDHSHNNRGSAPYSNRKL